MEHVGDWSNKIAKNKKIMNKNKIYTEKLETGRWNGNMSDKKWLNVIISKYLPADLEF